MPVDMGMGLDRYRHGVTVVKCNGQLGNASSSIYHLVVLLQHSVSPNKRHGRF